MKKRFLAVLLTLCMVLSLLPVSAFAAPGGSEYEIGDTFETTAPDQKPPENIPDGTEWVGPDAERGDLICKEEEHAHSLDSCYSHDCVHEHDDDCYPTQWVKCTKEDNPDHYGSFGLHKSDTECTLHYFGGFDYTWGYQVIDKTEGPTECRHECSLKTGCYISTCSKEEHQHGDSCYQWTYTWTLEEKTDENERGDQWRNWWPVYWSFDEYHGWGNEEITDPSLVTVSAGAKDVTYTGKEVSPQDALDDSEAANAGQLIRSGLDIRVAEGYYLSSYRLVCGNYTGCGVVEYGDAVTIEPDENGDYSAVTHVSIDENDFDHWRNVGGLGRNYPTSKPSEANWSNSYLGGNTIYPFYLLLELKEDENTYQIQYDWGDQSEALTEYDVPETQTGLKRNEEVQAAIPSDEAVQAALATGYVFDGWTISGTGYEDGSKVDAGGKVVIRGSDLTLTAKWVEAGTPEFLNSIKVTVSCTNQAAGHAGSQPMTLTAGDYTTSSRVVDRHLEYTVTISSERFVTAYNETTGATHTPAKDTATVTYVYHNGWNLKSGSNEAVTFQVVCEDQYTVTVKYVMDDADQTEIKTSYVSEEMSKGSPYDVSGQIPDSITYEGQSYAKDTVKGATSGTLTGNVEITAVYSLDEVGGENGGGDGVPDKYQKKVTFQVVNGTWADDTSAAKVTYVTLMKDGKWDVNGSASLTAPTGMKPNAGYGGTDGTQGGWDTTPPATVSGTDDVTYTYTFAKSTTPIVPGNVLYVVEHYKANDDGTYPVSATETERFSGAIGAEVTATPKVYEGYCLDPALSNTTGTLTKIEKPEDIVTLKLYYAVDKVGGEDGGDGTPDQYQAQVIYQVVGGTWANGSTEIEQVYHLSEYDETSDKWVEVSPAPTLTNIPDTTKVEPDAAHILSGAWDDESPVAGAALTAGTSTTYTYRLTAAAPAMTVEKTAQEASVRVGEQIHYTITVRNTGNAPLTDVTIEDTLWSAGTVIRVGDIDHTLSDSSYTISSIGVGDKVIITYAYTAAQTDVAAGVTNTAAVTADEIEDAVTDTTDPVPVTAYSLTYDANGGRIAGETTFVVPDLAQQTGYELGEEDDYTAPTHTDTEGAAVLFLGWTTTDNHEKIYDAGEQLPTLVSEVNIPAVATVYAVWAYDRNGDGTPDARQIMIQPADITIYTGGSSYESVVNGSGNEIGATDNGLPVPGFYITLPSDLNERLIKHADPADVVTNENGQQVVDLSKYLTFTYNFGGEQRIWKLERYDNNPGNTSMAYDRYIYRILPAETPNGEVPIRLQFTDQDDPDSFMTSDDFTVQVNSVFRQYDMTIYAGDLEQQRVKAELTVGADTEQYSAAVGSGTLTIRGVTDLDTATTPVVNEPPTNEVNSITAHIPADAALYINESRLEVADPDAVHLLVDSIVPDQGNTLHNSAVDGFNSITEDHSADLRYLDLVDTSNGNAYVTTDGEITLYWPYPDGTDRNSEFQLVHYAGLDRNSNTDLEQGNYTMELYSTEDGTLVATDEGIRFTVDSFSPFALFWEDEDDDDDRDDDDDDDDDDDRGHGGSGGTPQLNKEDHFAYVSGYPDGTVQPNDPITREEVATIFFRLLTDASRADYITERNPFPDVESSRWSFYSITTLNNGGIMTGRTGGDFDPGAYITRAEFAVVAAQFSDARYSGPDKFSDISGHWAREYINRAAAEGWIAGYPDGTYGPDRSITRAEVMALINEVLDRAPDADHMLDDMIHWPDNPEDAWYYEDVQEATNCHTYRWSGSLERWIQITDMRTYADLVRDALRSAR